MFKIQNGFGVSGFEDLNLIVICRLKFGILKNQGKTN